MTTGTSRLINLWRLLNLTCEGMSHLVSESLDRDLIPPERFALRAHLVYCSACRRYDRQLLVLRRALCRLSSRLDHDPCACDDLPGPGLPDDARERIERSLNGR